MMHAYLCLSVLQELNKLREYAIEELVRESLNDVL
jgi:hypothetical protein